MLLTTCRTALTAAPLALLAAIGLPGAPMANSVPVLNARTPKLEADSRDKKNFETVEFKTEDNITIRGNFYAPRKKGRAPAALLVHDEGSNALALSRTAELLQRKGFAVLAINLRGHGESRSEDCDWSKMDAETRPQAWTFAIRDLDAATNYLRHLESVHNSNLSLVGMGAGAVLAVRHAKRDENARAVALIEPEPKAFGYDMERDVCVLGGLPVLVLATDELRNRVTPIQAAASKANDGYDCVKLLIIKPKKSDDVFSDSRLNIELARFLEDEAMEKRE